jgi:hypothetical protein
MLYHFNLVLFRWIAGLIDILHNKRMKLKMLVFFAPARYRVVKIVCSSSELALQIMKYIVIYLSLGPSLEVRDLRPVVWYIR